MNSSFLTELSSHLISMTVRPDQLFLDPFNPRFEGKKELYKLPNNVADPFDFKLQERLREIMKKNYGISEIYESISKVGFLKMDRIVVYEADKDKYIALEGNRRVASIKSVIHDDENGRMKEPLSDKVKETLKEVEVLVLKCPEGCPVDLLDHAKWFLQGMRHISGVKDWGPYEKAKLISTLMDEQGVNFTRAGEAIGIGKKKAAIMFRALKGLQAMQDNPIYSEDVDSSYYSYFEVIFSKQELKTWFGWNDTTLRFENHTNLDNFYSWITGEKETRKISRAEDVRDRLPKIVKHDDIAGDFSLGKINLETAYELANYADRSGEVKWHAAVKSTSQALDRISPAHTLGEDELALLNDLTSKISIIIERLSPKP